MSDFRASRMKGGAALRVIAKALARLFPVREGTEGRAAFADPAVAMPKQRARGVERNTTARCGRLSVAPCSVGQGLPQVRCANP
jgi:hypothetical protein